MKKFIKLILLVCWLLVIYFFSSQDGTASSNLSNGLLKQIGLLLNVKDMSVFLNQFGVLIRKLAHFSEYFVLGVLMYINIKDYKRNKIVIVSFLLSFIYAISDEIHQLFVSQRAFAIGDILIDSLGSIVGILLIHLINMNASKRKSNNLRN